MLARSTIQLLRFHFSFFLLPVYLFALSQLPDLDWRKALFVFFILHFLVYPSSNGYNSYMDKDETPIGGLKNPMQPTKQLLHITVIMDVLAIGLSFLLSPWFALGVLLYIMASRAYSYRGIRLKKYAVPGYLTVVIFQGALIFFLSWHGSSAGNDLDVPVLPMIASSAIIGGYYPLTQVYQHEEDINDDVRTISYVLGKRGTFIFCGIVFALATLCMFFTFRQSENWQGFWLFLVFMSPVIVYFSFWMWKVWKDESKADFRSSLYMNILASVCTGLFFGTLLFMKGIE